MIIGELVCSPAGATSTYYSPWFARHGNAATFFLEILAVATLSLVVTIQTKNSEDVDPGSTASGGTISGSSVNRFSNRNHDLKELVRFKLEATGTSGSSAMGWAHMRMLNPVWETN